MQAPYNLIKMRGLNLPVSLHEGKPARHAEEPKIRVYPPFGGHYAAFCLHEDECSAKFWTVLKEAENGREDKTD